MWARRKVPDKIQGLIPNGEPLPDWGYEHRFMQRGVISEIYSGILSLQINRVFGVFMFT